MYDAPPASSTIARGLLRTSLFSGLGKFDVQNQVIIAVSVQFVNSILGVLVGGIADEGEATRSVSLSVLSQVDTKSVAKTTEQVSEIVL